MRFADYLKANGHTVHDVSFFRCLAGFSGNRIQWTVVFKDGTSIFNMVPGKIVPVSIVALGDMCDFDMSRPEFSPDEVREERRTYYPYCFYSLDGTDPIQFPQYPRS